MSILSRARQLVAEQLLYSTTPAREEARFQAYAAETTGRVVRIMAIAFCLSAFLWAWADWLLFSDSPALRTLAMVWRLGNLVTLVPVILLLPAFPRLSSHPLGLATTSMVLTTTWMTWNMGRIGPADASWFGPIFPIPGISIMLFVPFVQRFFLTALFAGSAWVGYFALNPARLAEEKAMGLVLSQQAVTVVLATGLGHLVYHYFRASFRAEQALAEANALLAERVRAQRADLRRLANHIETVREDERVDLARELHDELGQVLTALRFEFVLVESAARRQGGSLSLADVDFYLDRMRRAFRRLLQRLRPRILDDFGLVAAAEWLVSDVKAETGLTIEMQCAQELSVNGNSRVVAFRALRESLSNVIRHAQAKSVVIEIRIEGEEIVLSVTDDGRGMPPRSEWPSESIGIIGTRERARTLGGDFIVQPQQQGGTVAVLRIPAAGIREAA